VKIRFNEYRIIWILVLFYLPIEREKSIYPLPEGITKGRLFDVSVFNLRPALF
jgi:hypothetical protein